MGAAWEFFIATDAQNAAYLGPVNTVGEVRAVRRQLEALSVRAGFTHHWDPRLALAWIDRAVALTTDEARDALEAGHNYLAQQAATREVWSALGHAYNALNIPWLIDPEARERFTRRVGYGFAHYEHPCDWSEWREAMVTAEAPREGGSAFYVGPNNLHPTTSLPTPCVSIAVRYALTPGNALRRGVPDDAHWNLPYNELHGGYVRGAYTWRSWAIARQCAERGIGECDNWSNLVIPPTLWEWELARDIARSLRDRGPLRVISEATRYAFILNVRAAQAAGVLSAQLGDGAANVLAGMGDLNAANAKTPNGDVDQVADMIAVAATATAAIPVVAAILGCLSAAMRLVNRLLADATRPSIDEWGRNYPALELTYVTGGATRDDPPVHAVPDPPGWRRPFVLTFAPGPLLDDLVARQRALRAVEVVKGGRGGASSGAPVPAAVWAMGVAAVLGVVALATRDRWAGDVWGAPEARPRKAA